MQSRRNFISSSLLLFLTRFDDVLTAVNTQNKYNWKVPHADLANTGSIPVFGPQELPDIRWTFDESPSCVPIVVDNSVYITDFDNTLYSLKRNSGEINWEYQFETPSSYISYYNGSIFLPTNDYLTKVDAPTGQREWRQNDPDVFNAKISDGRIFGGTRGSVVALSTDTGDLLWRTGRSDRIFGLLGYENETLFATSIGESGIRIHSIHAGSGTQQWETPEFDASTGNVANRAGPAITDNSVLFASADGAVHSFDRSDGSKNWVLSQTALEFASGSVG